ncbi:MAG TPA: hypothetical protein VK756_02725 [Solirubrobacteraceae bacterium]|nr:hypothetical protein [Solirubrobacteraceae bacterium]
MQALFPIVMFGAIALFVLLGVLSMLTRSSNLYDQIGQGGLTLGEDRSAGHSAGEPYAGAGLGGAAESPPPRHDERESEIRQMLQARSDRLVRRGEHPLDIDAELARLEQADPFGSGASGAGGASHDSGLTLEVRQLVVARNERRRRQGQPALDVDAEVARTLAELNP